MALFKCKMCGGELEITEGSFVATCEYCGTTQTVPSADNEKKLTLFARANRLRVACEFDKAFGIYEAIVADFPEEAEAYWGLVLCKYGIEYVDDPKTAKKIPTCHRSSFESVMDDVNFEQVMENSDTSSRKIYREEAKQIEELRKGIVEISAKEEPYDIFICYKETDANGERTIDSVLAQDVYDALTEKGYRVFFSRITLEDKLGQEYEPYIFAALNSAKVMLVFGTDYEYFNAVWVKNEWSRFLELIAKGKKKTLIPCYKNIVAYDMPKEFARLQAQDMGKVGAVQDLIRGIAKIISSEKTVKVESQPAENINQTIEALIKEREEQKEQLEREQKEKKAKKVRKTLITLACSLLTLALVVGLVVVFVVVIIPQTKYNNAIDLMEKGKYSEAISAFEAIVYYKDSVEKKSECEKLSVLENKYIDAIELMDTEKYSEAIAVFESLAGYKDSENKTSECKTAILENKYNAAIDLMNAGSLDEANNIFVELGDYKDSPDKICDIRLIKTKEQLKDIKAGSYIKFGTYEQDNNISNGKEDIEWLALEVKDGKALLISKYALDYKPYNTSSSYVTWENCTLREWLNGEFINSAFSNNGKVMIPTVTVSADKNPDYSTNPGNATQDQVFLLSITETNKYFSSNRAGQCEPTDYAVANRGYLYDQVETGWWLRSPGRDQRLAAFFGDISNIGSGVSFAYHAVRPALWIDLNA